MKVTVRYNLKTLRFFVNLFCNRTDALVIRDVNYYAFRALVHMHYDELSKLEGVTEVLDTEENLSREYYQNLEAQMSVMAAWFKIDTEEHARKMFGEILKLLNMHMDKIRELSRKSGELTAKTDTPPIQLNFEVVE